MKRILLISQIFFVCWLLPDQLNATFIAATDLSLTCLGGNDYKVRLVIYRDCSGIPASYSVTIPFQCTSSPQNDFTLNLVPLVPGSGQQVVQNCNAMPTKCSGGSLYGLQEYIYEALVTLPPCNFWRISWTSCCRSPSNTISSPTGTYAYIEATINNLTAHQSSTPILTTKPTPVFCVGQKACVNLGAYDRDGDSLSYSLVTPFKNSNTTFVSWIPPSTATQPFPSNPPITLDPVTGTLCMTPTISIVSPMAIKVEKWRSINGVPTLIGSIYRDMQVNALACNNTIPMLSGIDTTMVKGYAPDDTTYSMVICYDDSVKFAIWGYDADIPSTTTPGAAHKFKISWNNGIPLGTFTAFNQNTNAAYATFHWKPDLADRGNIRCFTATITDSACPYFGIQSFAYCFLIQDRVLSIGPDTLLCKGESITFQAKTDTLPAYYIWYLNGIYTGTPLTNNYYSLSTVNLPAGIHEVSVKTNFTISPLVCSGSAHTMLQVVNQPSPNLGNDTIIYANQPLTLDAGPGAQYYWNTGAQTQQITVNTTGQYKVIVDGGLGTRCVGSDSIYVQFITGIDDPEPDRHTSIWPNPSDGSLNIGFNQPCETGTTISVLNAEGRCVMENIHVAPGSLHTSISVNNLPNGIYLLKISTENESITHKFILTKR